MAIYRRYVSKMSWFWQDSRVVYPKSPANRRFGMHHVKNLPGRGAFPVRDLQIIHSVKILPPLRSRSFSFAATLVPVLPRHRCPPYRTRFLATPSPPPSWPFSLAVCCSFRATGALRLAVSAPRVVSLAPRFVAAFALCAALSVCSPRILRAVIVILMLWLVRETFSGLLLG